MNSLFLCIFSVWMVLICASRLSRELPLALFIVKLLPGRLFLKEFQTQTTTAYRKVPKFLDAIKLCCKQP